MKRLYCFLMVFMIVLLSPLSAYASTTESMLMYVAVEDEYSVMPLAAYDAISIGVGAGWYDRTSDSFSTGQDITSVNYNVMDSSIINGSDFINYSNRYLPAYAFFLFGDNLGTTGVTNRYYADRIQLEIGNPNNIYLYATPSDLNIFKSYAVVKMAGTVQVGNSHFGVNGTSDRYAISTIPLSSIYTGLSNTADQSLNMAVDFTLNIDNPDKVIYKYDSNYTYEWTLGDYDPDSTINTNKHYQRFYNARIIEISVYTIVDPVSFSSVNGDIYFNDSFANQYPLQSICFMFDGGNVFITSDDVIASGDTSVVNSISNSIANSTSTITRAVSSQINQVKTTITNSTNAINTRIQTMETNVVNGLNNVISSAQQNTQNIINTVTQKVDEVKTSVGEVKDAVVDLPNKLEEKAIGLVVPEDQVIADKFDDFTGTLEQELGILYEVPQMVYDLGDTITSNIAEPQKQMTFPAFSLSMPDGQDYQIWGDIVFDIMPAGMEVLQDFCMTITGLIMVTATVNAVKEQYELFIRDQKGR